MIISVCITSIKHHDLCNRALQRVSHGLPYHFTTDRGSEELFATRYEGAGEQDGRRGLVEQLESAIVNFDLIHLGDELEG